MTEERIPKKMQHTKMDKNNKKEDPKPYGQIKLQGFILSNYL